MRLSLGSAEALASFTNIIRAKTTWIIFWQTIDMAIVATLISLPIGYCSAYVLVWLPKRQQHALLLLILLPYWISTLVRSYAWIAILGREGAVNGSMKFLGLTTEPLALLFNRFGANIGNANVVAPIMILILYSAFSRIDKQLVHVASAMGGRPLFVFGRIWLPLSIPGVVSGCILVFLISLGVFTTPSVLGGPTETSIAMAIEQEVHTVLDLPAAAGLSTLLLMTTVAMLGVSQRFWVPALLGRPVAARTGATLPSMAAFFDQMERLLSTLPKTRARTRSRASGPKGFRPHGLLWMVGAGSLAYLLAPVAVVLLLSFSSASVMQFPPTDLSLRWFKAFFNSAEWVGSAVRSLVVAALTTFAATILGVATAYGLERGLVKQKHWLYVVFLSPLVVPPTIIAFGLYYIYAKLGWIGSLPALAAAHVVIVLPFTFVTLCQGIRTIDPILEFAASGLGGKPIYVFRRITLPLLGPAMLSGSLLAFLTSFDELIIALFITSARGATLPKQMWDSVRFGVDPTNAAAATLLIALSAVIVGTTFFAESRRRTPARSRVTEV